MTSALDCFGAITIDDITATIINGIALLLITFLALITYDKFQDHKMNHRGLRLFFYLAAISSFISCIGGICQNVLCMIMGTGIEWLMVLICFIGYVSLLQCVLGIFLLRLYVTFLDSQFALSPMKRIILGIAYCSMVIMWIVQILLLFHIVFVQQRYTEESFVIPLFLWSLMLLTLILFVVLSIWTVFEFCRNLLLTAKMRSNWTRTKGLDTKQHQIINVSSKYLSLFMFAACTTLFNFGIFSLCTYNDLDPSILVGMDCIVNVLCLFLQYGFAAIYYYRYCRRLDVCCRRIMTWRMGKHDQEIKAKRAMLTVPKPMSVDEQNIAKNMAMDWNRTISEPTPHPNKQRDTDSEHVHQQSNDKAANQMDPSGPSPPPQPPEEPVINGNDHSFKPQINDITVITESALAHRILTRISSTSPISATTTRCSNDNLPTMAMAATASSEGSMAPSADETVSSEAPEAPSPASRNLRLEVNCPLQEEVEPEDGEEESTWNISNSHRPVPNPAPSSPTATSTVHSDDWQSTQL